MAENERLLEELKVACPSFVYGEVMNPHFIGDLEIMLSVEYQVNRNVARCLCKITFN